MSSGSRADSKMVEDNANGKMLEISQNSLLVTILHICFK